VERGLRRAAARRRRPAARALPVLRLEPGDRRGPLDVLVRHDRSRRRRLRRRDSEGALSMRFGMFIPQGWRFDLVGIDPAEQWGTMSRLAAQADAGPWESLWVYDHFHTTPVPSQEATHEAWSLMSAFGATTSRIRLGQMCTCMSYRNPAYLAKVAATVDAISGGRLEMGIGGGWYEHEWRADGYGLPEVKDRLGVQIGRASGRGRVVGGGGRAGGRT